MRVLSLDDMKKGEYVFEDGASFDSEATLSPLAHPTKDRPKFQARNNLKVENKPKHVLNKIRRQASDEKFYEPKPTVKPRPAKRPKPVVGTKPPILSPKPKRSDKHINFSEKSNEKVNESNSGPLVNKTKGHAFVLPPLSSVDQHKGTTPKYKVPEIRHESKVDSYVPKKNVPPPLSPRPVRSTHNNNNIAKTKPSAEKQKDFLGEKLTNHAEESKKETSKLIEIKIDKNKDHVVTEPSLNTKSGEKNILSRYEKCPEIPTNEKAGCSSNFINQNTPTKTNDCNDMNSHLKNVKKQGSSAEGKQFITDANTTKAKSDSKNNPFLKGISKFNDSVTPPIARFKKYDSLEEKQSCADPDEEINEMIQEKGKNKTITETKKGPGKLTFSPFAFKKEKAASVSTNKFTKLDSSPKVSRKMDNKDVLKSDSVHKLETKTQNLELASTTDFSKDKNTMKDGEKHDGKMDDAMTSGSEKLNAKANIEKSQPKKEGGVYKKLSFDDLYSPPHMIRSYSLVTYTPKPAKRRVDANGRIMDKRGSAQNDIVRSLSPAMKYEEIIINGAPWKEKSKEEEEHLLLDNSERRRHTFSQPSTKGFRSRSHPNGKASDKVNLISNDSTDDESDEDLQLNKQIQNSERLKTENKTKSKKIFGILRKHNGEE